MCVAGAGSCTGALVTDKPGLFSLLSSASSFFQKTSARRAAAAVLYTSTLVRTAVTPSSPVNALPHSSPYPARRPSFLNVFGVASDV